MRARRASGRPADPDPPDRRAPSRAWVWAAAGLLALHVALAAWVALSNSVTFDENFHLPAGVVALTKADFSTSYAQPPLARELYGAAALLAGARPPDSAALAPGFERRLAESFMRRNADRYTRVFLAGRAVSIALSALLGAWVWLEARRRWGDLAGLVALGAWVFTPETLAHGSVVGTDLPTALTTFGVVLSGDRWLASGRVRDGLIAAGWTAAAFLVRLSAAQVLLVLGALAALRAAAGSLPRPRVAVGGLVVLGLVAWLAVDAGYLFQGVGTPLGRIEFHSPAFLAMGRALAAVPSPFPEPWLRGLDYVAYLAQPGVRTNYLFGEASAAHHPAYIFVAMAVKWPLGLLALLALRLARVVAWREFDPVAEAPLLVPALVVIAMAAVANLEAGVRYVLPALPFLMVWAAGAAAPARAHGGGRRAWAVAAVALALAIPVEAARAMPYPLSFFNGFAAAPGAGERIVNDSNVDWGQGLLALRDELRRRGISRVYLTYHGTTDPAVYGIDYVPYAGGPLGTASDWLAVSSYYYVGLPARMMTREGSTPLPVAVDCRALWHLRPVAHPAGCMWLFRIR